MSLGKLRCITSEVDKDLLANGESGDKLDKPVEFELELLSLLPPPLMPEPVLIAGTDPEPQEP